MQEEHQDGGTETGGSAASADESKRRTKLMELARRRSERGSQTAEAAAASAAGPNENERDDARESPESGAPASEGPAREDGPLGPFDRGAGRRQPGGEGALRRELIRRALEKRLAGGQGADDDANARPGRLLRRLQEGGGGEGRREGAGREGAGRGLLLRRILEKRMESGGRRGPSEREAELEERVRKLEAELKKLTDS